MLRKIILEGYIIVPDADLEIIKNELKLISISLEKRLAA